MREQNTNYHKCFKWWIYSNINCSTFFLFKKDVNWQGGFLYILMIDALQCIVCIYWVHWILCIGFYKLHSKQLFVLYFLHYIVYIVWQTFIVLLYKNLKLILNLPTNQQTDIVTYSADFAAEITVYYTLTQWNHAPCKILQFPCNYEKCSSLCISYL